MTDQLRAHRTDQHGKWSWYVQHASARPLTAITIFDNRTGLDPEHWSFSVLQDSAAVTLRIAGRAQGLQKTEGK